MDQNNHIQLGDIPCLLFVPASLPPGSLIPHAQILVVNNPALYIFARDLVVADQQTPQFQQISGSAAEEMMKALLQFKPNDKPPISPTEYESLEDQWKEKPSEDALPPDHPHHKKEKK
ncbi:MAG TPA: hypothetical protein ENI23_02845 [bacterium]|nr:hypothetical protein [bacterium]